MNDFTARSLAFMFMDDGSKTNNSYTIATQCFTKNNLEEFKKVLFTKFGIETTLHKHNQLYIRACSAALFKSLIEPYMCDCMKYKLH